MEMARLQNPLSDLTRSLVIELFQTERSAIEHPKKEARRLGEDVSPARAMTAVSEHAVEALRDLERIADELGLEHTRKGQAIGDMFSKIRSFFLDLVLTRERTYRGTLLGLRHGADLVRLLRDTVGPHQPSLANWCDHWLRTRVPLVHRVADQMVWFAAHPRVARELATCRFRHG
jgi:hypothetical protein